MSTFEVRFESIGGLGAHLAAQILAEALVLRQRLNASQFSSYGSEKKGTPIRSFIRATEADKPIRDSSPVTKPDVLAVFHEALLPRRSTLAGLKPTGVLVINRPRASALPLPRARVFLVDAMAIAVEERTRINTAILGAVAKACPRIDAKALAATLEERFRGKSAKLAEMNLKTYWRGYEEVVEQTMTDGEEIPPADGATAAPRWGYLTGPLGGTILEPGSTAVNNLSASRPGFAPKFDPARCNHCGVCDLVCPDYCLVWEGREMTARFQTGKVEWDRQAARLLGIDYQYCKGCLRCVDSCPSGALTKELEGPWVKEAQVPLWQKESK